MKKIVMHIEIKREKQINLESQRKLFKHMVGWKQESARKKKSEIYVVKEKVRKQMIKSKS
jgi:hypothetical protein